MSNRTWLQIILWGVILAFILMLASRSEADFHAIELQELSIDYKNYSALNSNAYDPLIYPEKIKEGIDIGINTDILKYGYFNSKVEALTTDAQYRDIGLELRAGVRLLPILDVGYYHHSSHVLDEPQPVFGIFPHEDAIELKLYLYHKERHSVF